MSQRFGNREPSLTTRQEAEIFPTRRGLGMNGSEEAPLLQHDCVMGSVCLFYLLVAAVRKLCRPFKCRELGSDIGYW